MGHQIAGPVIGIFRTGNCDCVHLSSLFRNISWVLGRGVARGCGSLSKDIIADQSTDRTLAIAPELFDAFLIPDLEATDFSKALKSSYPCRVSNRVRVPENC